ncbi:hypothetical protein HPB50_027698 [Hyalomma asiaticum]|nr:hypothetical protein HPB50_027698 [Hyalomma asiaticum]
MTKLCGYRQVPVLGKRAAMYCTGRNTMVSRCRRAFSAVYPAADRHPTPASTYGARLVWSCVPASILCASCCYEASCRECAMQWSG